MNPPDWKEMYQLAEEILQLAPWESYFEGDLFALQPRADGPVYFASVMGSAGSHHAIAYYPGIESLAQFRISQAGDLPERIQIESILLNQHLQVIFDQRKFLIPPDLAVLKSLGKKYRGKWPAFRSHQPARFPWFPAPDEAEKLRALMTHTLPVLRRLNTGEDLLRPFDEEEFFLRTWDGRDSLCNVSDLPFPRHILKAELPAGALDGIHRKKMRVEMDLVLMVTPITDVPPGQAPYLPIMLLMVDSRSGIVMGFETLSTKQGMDAAMVGIPDAITRILKKAKVVPDTIAANHPILLSALESYCEAYGLKCQPESDLPAAEEAIDSLFEFMQQ